MDGNTAEIRPHHLDLARMKPCSNIDAQTGHLVTNGTRRSDGPSRTVEASQEPVAHPLDLVAVILLQLAADDFVVLVEEGTPAPVAQVGRTLCGSNDVGEQNGGKHAIGFSDTR